MSNVVCKLRGGRDEDLNILVIVARELNRKLLTRVDRLPGLRGLDR